MARTRIDQKLGAIIPEQKPAVVAFVTFLAFVFSLLATFLAWAREFMCLV